MMYTRHGSDSEFPLLVIDDLEIRHIISLGIEKHSEGIRKGHKNSSGLRFFLNNTWQKKLFANDLQGSTYAYHTILDS